MRSPSRIWIVFLALSACIAICLWLSLLGNKRTDEFPMVIFLGGTWKKGETTYIFSSDDKGELRLNKKSYPFDWDVWNSQIGIGVHIHAPDVLKLQTGMPKNHAGSFSSDMKRLEIYNSGRMNGVYFKQ